MLTASPTNILSYYDVLYAMHASLKDCNDYLILFKFIIISINISISASASSTAQP